MKLTRHLTALAMLVSYACLAGEVDRISVQEYLDVNIETITANEWKYFFDGVQPKKELEHEAKRVTAEINLDLNKNKEISNYLQRVIETSVMELEIRDGHNLVVFTEIKPEISDSRVVWSADYSASNSYRVILWLRYSYTDNEYPFMAEPIPLYLLREWRASGS